MRAEPLPQRGERREPNPLFLAHAAAVSDLYVALATEPPTGLTLVGFARESDSREPFRDSRGRDRAIAPDTRITLRIEDRCDLVGFVELDRGTMSRTRLRAKAAGYVEYARRSAWRERHAFCPALLFITTTPSRAKAFCLLINAEMGGERPSEPLRVAACSAASDLAAAVHLACWQDADGSDNLSLTTCLQIARRRYDEVLASTRAEQDRYEQTLADPVALRAFLRDRLRYATTLEHDFGPRAGQAISLLLASEAPLEPSERATLEALATEMDQRQGPAYATLAPTPRARQLLEGLAEAYRAQQGQAIDALRARFGDGPHLRAAAKRLDSDELLDHAALDDLKRWADEDRVVRNRQAELRAEYLAVREQHARRLRRAEGSFSARLRAPDAFTKDVDRQWLRICPRCQEVIYPSPDSHPDSSARSFGDGTCPFCHSQTLEPWTAGFENSEGTGEASDPVQELTDR